MELRFDLNKIQSLADKYCTDSPDEAHLERRFLERANSIAQQREPALDLALLKDVARWKSPRSAHHVDRNCDEYVREVTAVALSTSSERLRIESLTLLDGVSWATASVILHFFHRDRYPILDFRALWSVQAEEPNEYTFDFWWKYVLYCRGLADQAQVDMRTLDRALWKHSKRHQTRGRSCG